MDRLHLELEGLDLENLEIEEMELLVDEAGLESLTVGHGMVEIGASVLPALCCSCCIPCCCCCTA